MNIDIGVIIPVVGALVAVVNIVTNVIKKATWDKIPTNIIVLALSIVLTLVAFFAYAQITAITVAWYMIVGAVVVGFFVAYAAMFGFDKFKETISGVKERR